MLGRTLIAAALVAAGSAAPAQTPAAPPAAPIAPAAPTATLAASTISAEDQRFVTRTAEGGRVEVELARIAQQKAATDMVRQFAARMLTEHGKANEELAALARAKNLSLPPPPTSDARAIRLQRLTGGPFDRAYMQQMVDDHQASVAMFENEARNGRDGQIKAFATKSLPILQEHLRLAQAMLESLPKS